MMRPRLNEFVQVSVRGGVSRGRVTAVREGERYDIQHQDGSRSRQLLLDRRSGFRQRRQAGGPERHEPTSSLTPARHHATTE